MAFYARPKSIDLVVEGVQPSNSPPLKQKDILIDILGLIQQSVDPQLKSVQIKGFQRINSNNYIITLDTDKSRNSLMTFLKTNPKSKKYHYTPNSADFTVGRLTLTGIPVEFTDTEIEQLLSNFVEITHIKRGMYKQFPYIYNGIRHVAYKKLYREPPTKMFLSVLNHTFGNRQ